MIIFIFSIKFFFFKILNEVAQHQIKIYDFPDEVLPPTAVGAPGAGSGAGAVDRKLRDRIPMAVVGSNTIVEVDGKKLRGRKYPWGVAEGENYLSLHHI